MIVIKVYIAKIFFLLHCNKAKLTKVLYELDLFPTMDTKQRNCAIKLFNKHIKKQFSVKASSTTVLQANKKKIIMNYLKCEDEIKSLGIQQKKSNRNKKKELQKEIVEAMLRRESYSGHNKWKKRYSLEQGSMVRSL
jgi:competence transcription factor ComK